MKYLVMELHPAYAVLLDEQGRFLKAANLGYSVGQQVEKPVLLRSPRLLPVNFAAIGGLAGLARQGLCDAGGGNARLLQGAEDEIRQGLEQKLDALVRHELYAKYKTAPSAEEREQARQEYLDRRGVFPDFRW